MHVKTPNPPAINAREWNDPANWSHRSLFGLYFSKRDRRIWVPKAIPMLGWTLNLAHPAAILRLAVVFSLAVAAAVRAATAL